MGDRSGMKPVLVIGVVVFTCGSFLAGLSGSVSQMIVFRIVQGAGAAMMSAVAGALVVKAFPVAERGRVLGITLASAYTGLTAGPAAGGVLVQVFGWRSIFYVNVPIGIAYSGPRGRLPQQREGLDRRSAVRLPGAIALTAFLVTMLLALSGLAAYAWETALLVLSCMGSFAGFLLLEPERAPFPSST